ncbi:palindromic element RPE3 domain-containing protein [Rickettsia endosymbiont of Ceutorhynchus assimilis]|uniref:palindromic element RPE3 domain-containing protein n=1 Tax=unclassified Rickettsia TaxID=114295 RepID=UPI00209D48E8|nr:palindromic element RPE3 domain-containing protein [Rickettsia endosymbiont of Ceutorhynchus assimilis]
MSLLHASILTVFPEMFPGPLGLSLAGQALHKNIWSYDIVNIRDFGITKHKNVDDEAYGGGDGLIMRPDVLGAAIDYSLSLNPGSKIYYPSPRGKLFNQSLAREMIRLNSERFRQDEFNGELARRTGVCEHRRIQKNSLVSSFMNDAVRQDKIIILCGRYEGIDERVIEEYNINEISVGDYILSGGELPTLTILDCLIRLLPGVLINQNTLSSESFEQDGEFAGLLECALYTRPENWRGRKVPSVLLSGNPRLINEWKCRQSTEVTKLRRPDLLTRI